MTKRFKKTARIVFSILFASFISTILVAAIVFEPMIKIKGFGSLDPDKLVHLNNSLLFNDNSNERVQDELLASAAIYIPVVTLNQATIDAFISVEDKRFYDHDGVDLYRIAGATLENIKHLSYKEGGSTISQQLIKNTHLTSEKKLKRKIEEIRIARALERKYSKNEILSMYLNSLYFGNGIYGIGSAAMIYFDKSATDLTLDESAMLAGLINSPARYCPYTKYDNCLQRRNLVLNRMLKNDKISKAQYNDAIDTATCVSENIELTDQYFSNAINEAAHILNSSAWDVRRENLTINTFYDHHLNEYIKSVYEQTNIPFVDEVDVSCIVIDNTNSQILSFCGTGKKNYLNMKRSPASTIKPILSYAPALESGLIHTISPILDQKSSFGSYSPRNYLDKYLGWISVEESLVVSSNVAAVRLLEMNGVEYSKSIANSFGLDFADSDVNLAIALGGMENGVTLNEIANAYQALSSGGRYKKTSHIKSIIDENGKVLYQDDRQSRRAVSQETAFLINNMLISCAQKGTARQLKSLKNVAAKTGTNGTKEGNTDAYCISYTPKYTVAVWIGAKSGVMPNSISGGGLPARINKSIMEYLLSSTDAKDNEFAVPSGILKAYVDKESLEKDNKIVLANDMTPPAQRIEAYFNKRYLPNETSLKYFNKFILDKDLNVFYA